MEVRRFQDTYRFTDKEFSSYNRFLKEAYPLVGRPLFFSADSFKRNLWQPIGKIQPLQKDYFDSSLPYQLSYKIQEHGVFQYQKGELPKLLGTSRICQ